MPFELYQSQKEYYDKYLLIVFRKHIDQEERCCKLLAYYSAKNKHTEQVVQAVRNDSSKWTSSILRHFFFNVQKPALKVNNLL